MVINVGLCVDKGGGEKNDDRVLADSSVYDVGNVFLKASTPVIVAVADGVGGRRNGGQAANYILDKTGKIELPLSEEKLAKELNNINLSLCKEKEEANKKDEMFTTVAGVVFQDDSTLIFHSGDSRVYRFDGNNLRKMTYDHSTVQEMVDLNFIVDETEIETDGRNCITRYYGDTNVLPSEIREIKVSIKDKETYVICSDGVWDNILVEEMKNILISEIKNEIKAKEIICRAKENGSKDNLSVCVCTLGESGEL